MYILPSLKPKANSSPLKIGFPKRKLVFQPFILRGYVSFREIAPDSKDSLQEPTAHLDWRPDGNTFNERPGTIKKVNEKSWSGKKGHPTVAEKLM